MWIVDGRGRYRAAVPGASEGQKAHGRAQKIKNENDEQVPKDHIDTNNLLYCNVFRLGWDYV